VSIRFLRTAKVLHTSPYTLTGKIRGEGTQKKKGNSGRTEKHLEQKAKKRQKKKKKDYEVPGEASNRKSERVPGKGIKKHKKKKK